MQIYIDLLKNLMFLHPVSENVGDVNKTAETIGQFLQQRGVHCRWENLNGRKILYASTLNETSPDILFNAHIDVVDAEETMFHPEIRDGWIYGRGSGDCLGNAVCLVKVLCELNGIASAGVIFTADEELGGETTEYMVQHGYGAKKLVCVMDHWDEDSIGYAQKGAFSVKMTAYGCGGHGSTPWRFDNPIDKLVDAYCRFRSTWVNPTEDDQWHKSMTATILNAGISQTMVPDTAEMRLNFRYTEANEKAKILASMKEITGLEIVPLGGCEPMSQAKEIPILQDLSQIMQATFGHGGDFRRLNGATDARWFLPLNLPVAILGIQTVGIHSSREKAEIDSIEKYASVLIRLLQKQTSMKP